MAKPLFCKENLHYAVNIQLNSAPLLAGSSRLSVYNGLRFWSNARNWLFDLQLPRCNNATRLGFLGVVLPKFEKLRVSLEGAPRATLGVMEDDNALTRKEFLQLAFSEERAFLPKGSKQKVSFIPITAPEGYVAGFFAKECDVVARPRQANKFPEVNHENWELALFVIDVHDKSQISWFQKGTPVGSPKAILESFFQGLPKGTKLRQYQAAIRYMDSEKTYWAAIEKNRDRITKLSFEFLPPNALKGRDKVQEFVRRAQQTGNPSSQTHIYKSNAGQMDPSSEILEGSAEVALEGAGEATVYAGKEKIWTSSGGRTVDEVGEEIMPTPEDPKFIALVIEKLFFWRSDD